MSSSSNQYTTGDVTVCINVWAVCDPDRDRVTRVAVKLYALGRTDHEKVGVLRILAPTDFHTAELHELPSDRQLADGKTVPQVLNFDQLAADVFEPCEEIIKSLENCLPERCKKFTGQRRLHELWLEHDPLILITRVHWSRRSNFPTGEEEFFVPLIGPTDTSNNAGRRTPSEEIGR